jgi:hypothetical protein
MRRGEDERQNVGLEDEEIGDEMQNSGGGVIIL